MTRHERALLLAARRESLVTLSQLQRDGLRAHCQALEPPLRWVERGWHGWMFLRGHAWAALVPLAAVSLARPRWFGRLATGLLTLVRVGRWLR
jgi:YqjK-like protein